MKFHFFHLMPYPELPADFQEKHRSVWVDVDSRLFDPEVGHRAYNDYLDEHEYADQLGFDGIGVNEHHSIYEDVNAFVGAVQDFLNG